MPDMGTPENGLMETLTPVARLALAYAPARARPLWLGLLALDARLAGVVRGAREPMLAQIRLAWWRERLADAAANWPEGEPLLAQLRLWNEAHQPLAGLTDGWEALVGEAPLPADMFRDFAQARGVAVRGLATALGLGEHGAAAEALASRWALADLVGHIAHPGEREDVQRLLAQAPLPRQRLPRGLRPLAVLHGLAVKQAEAPDAAGWGLLLRAFRLGSLGF